MAEENNVAATDPTQEQPKQGEIGVQKLFLKDVSFEAPAAPEIFRDSGQTDINLNLSQTVKEFETDIYEVILSVTITAKLGDKTAYLVEVQQGGLFGVRGFEKQQVHAILGSYCPQILYPYARSLIADLVAHGGFPPLVLQHVDFNAVYLAHLKQQQEANAAKEAETGTEAASVEAEGTPTSH